TVQDRLADRRDGSGVVHVGPEVAAVIDSGEDPLRLGDDPMEANSDTIGRSAVDREAFLATWLQEDRFARGHDVAAARLRARGGDNDGIAYCARRGQEGAQAF